MAGRSRRSATAQEDERIRNVEEEQRAAAPQGMPVPPPPPAVDYGTFMHGLVQAIQTQAQTQAALQAQFQVRFC